MKTSSIGFYLTILILSSYNLSAQKIKAKKGSIEALSGISEYNLIMEYDENLTIPNYDSESDFVEFQRNKKEALEEGSGDLFVKEWFENRTKVYRPEFIKAFNAFKLEKRQVQITESPPAKYTMVVNTLLIYPGYHVEVWYEHTKLEVILTIYETSNPDNVLFKSDTIHAEGRGGATDKERISTAYLNLGRQLSKFLHRKT